MAKDNTERVTTKRECHLAFVTKSQIDANCKENDIVAVDFGASRVRKRQTDFRDNRLYHFF